MNNTSSIMTDHLNEKFGERQQINYICETFRKVMKNGKEAEMIPIVIYNKNHKVPNGGQAEVIEIHGIFSVNTVQTAIFRLQSDLDNWNNSSDTEKPNFRTQMEKDPDGNVKILRFVKLKEHPYWAPHRRRFSV